MASFLRGEFVDRPSLMIPLREKLSIPESRVALIGPHGSGKSQLAIDYCNSFRHRSPTPLSIWVNAGTQQYLMQSIRMVIEKMRIPAEEVNAATLPQRVRDWLRRNSDANFRWLLVLDGIRPASVPRGAVPSNGRDPLSIDDMDPLLFWATIADAENGNVLMTSTCSASINQLLRNAQVIHVGTMLKEEALLLANKRLGQYASRQLTESVVDCALGWPLVVALLSACIPYGMDLPSIIRKTHMSWTKYDPSRHKLNIQGSEAFPSSQMLQRILAIFRMTSEKHPRKLRLLERLSVCGRCFMTPRMAALLLPNYGQPAASEPRSDPARASRATSVDLAALHNRLNEDLVFLTKCCFIFKSSVFDSDVIGFFVHPLVRIAMHIWLIEDHNGLKHAVSGFAESLDARLDGKVQSSWGAQGDSILPMIWAGYATATIDAENTGQTIAAPRRWYSVFSKAIQHLESVGPESQLLVARSTRSHMWGQLAERVRQWISEARIQIHHARDARYSPLGMEYAQAALDHLRTTPDDKNFPARVNDCQIYIDQARRILGLMKQQEEVRIAQRLLIDADACLPRVLQT